VVPTSMQLVHERGEHALRPCVRHRRHGQHRRGDESDPKGLLRGPGGGRLRRRQGTSMAVGGVHGEDPPGAVPAGAPGHGSSAASWPARAAARATGDATASHPGNRCAAGVSGGLDGAFGASDAARPMQTDGRSQTGGARRADAIQRASGIRAEFPLERLAAVIFDMDGVVHAHGSRPLRSLEGAVRTTSWPGGSTVLDPSTRRITGAMSTASRGRPVSRDFLASPGASSFPRVRLTRCPGREDRGRPGSAEGREVPRTRCP